MIDLDAPRWRKKFEEVKATSGEGRAKPVEVTDRDRFRWSSGDTAAATSSETK